MSGVHAFLPPSSAASWRVCALWAMMNRLYPELGEKPEAKEGEAAHWAFAEMLYQRPTSAGPATPNGVALTEEMLEAAQMYVDVVTEAYGALGAVSHYKVEQWVNIPGVHANNGGTPDTWLFGHNPTSGRAKLVVPDFKYGFELVEVFENWQLIDYTCGILDELGIDGLADQLTDVEFIIVQPRAPHRDGPVRRWKTTAANLRGHFNILRLAAERAHDEHPTATPEPDNCKHCPGRHACEALQREGYKTAAVSRMSTPLEMSQEAMGLELKLLQRSIKLAEARASGLEQQIEHALTAGQYSPHFAMESTPARLTWTKPDEEILALGVLLGADLAAKPAAITPTQAGKVLDPEVLKMYSFRPRGSLKLVPVNVANLRKVFGSQS